MRDLYAQLDGFIHRIKAASALLDVTEVTLRAHEEQSGIKIKRANEQNQSAPATRIYDIPTIFRLSQWKRSAAAKKIATWGRPIIIATHVMKGGTGKSTSTAELTVQLQLAGYKVCAIDLDGQANLTQLMGYESDFEPDEAPANGLSDAAIVHGTFNNICGPFITKEKSHGKGREVALSDVSGFVKYPFGPDGPAFIPSDTFIGELEESIYQSQGLREHLFRRFFDAAVAGEIPGFNAAQFDFILMDCPPSVSFISTNAIACADFVIAPIKMESFGVKGLSKLVGELERLKELKVGIPPELIILPTHFSTNIRRVGRMHDKLQFYRDNLAPTSISTSELFPKHQEYYLPLTLQLPTSQPVKEYRDFANHLISRANIRVAELSARRKLG